MKYVNLAKSDYKTESVTQIHSKPKPRGIRGIALLTAAALFIIVSYSVLGGSVKALFNPVSIVGSVASVKLLESDGKTNILLIGSDKRHQGSVVSSELTDTLIVASVDRYSNRVTMISLPRDLWVQSPSGFYAKINEVYAYSDHDVDEVIGTIENVLGIPIHYHVKITFDIFEKGIDTIGGVEVPVERAFTDYYYPVEGMENAPEELRYEVVHFDEGLQKMDGATALKYVRSRKGDNNEGTDFARAKRQQNLIAAVKNKVLSTDVLLNPGRIKELYDLYANNVETNLSFEDIQSFAVVAAGMKQATTDAIVLDDRSETERGGLLYAPEDRTLYGDKYVLIPKTGDFSQIHAYIQRFLFSSEE